MRAAAAAKKAAVRPAGEQGAAGLIRAAQTCRGKVSGLAEDEAWRDFLERVTTRRSLREMSPPQIGRVIEELHRLGAPRLNRPLPSPQARLARGLWIELAEIGAVRDRSDAALNAFVRRQSNVDAARWLTEPAEAKKVVEALKAWVKRARLAQGEGAP
jgi:phage gp16-like protein